ncbi:MAG TPA: MBL fold metallo-hydrolase [Polyangia bacterium]|nr:MBL fold metallo-hydrolase [Polyangia bacterium]
MARGPVHELRRQLNRLELEIFTGAGMTQGEVLAAAGPLADGVDDEARERVRALSIAAATGARDRYRAQYGVCGLRPFQSASGARIFLLPIETFPNHVNNVYLILGRGHAPLLYDAGSGTANTRDDFERAARVLREVYEQGAPLDEVRDVVISHGHIDHFGGVGFWRERGCAIHVHEYDLRVLTNFAERIVVAALGVRAFLRHAGVPADELRELEEMYVASKNFFQPVPVDRVLTDGARVYEYVAHHAPGHCPGQVCLQIDNILLTADHVLPRITPHQSPESITPSTGLDHYLEALEKIRHVAGIDLALPGHEEPIEHLYQRITEIEEFHRRRLEKVRMLCARGGAQTVREIALELFGPRSGYDRILALQEAGAHVEYLARRGILEIDNVDDLLRERDPVLRYRAATSTPAPGSA